jgi:hypothetical protein
VLKWSIVLLAGRDPCYGEMGRVAANLPRDDGDGVGLGIVNHVEAILVAEAEKEQVLVESG